MSNLLEGHLRSAGVNDVDNAIKILLNNNIICFEHVKDKVPDYLVLNEKKKILQDIGFSEDDATIIINYLIFEFREI